MPGGGNAGASLAGGNSECSQGLPAAYVMEARPGRPNWDGRNRSPMRSACPQHETPSKRLPKGRRHVLSSVCYRSWVALSVPDCSGSGRRLSGPQRLFMFYLRAEGKTWVSSFVPLERPRTGNSPVIELLLCDLCVDCSISSTRVQTMLLRLP